jgi:two-component system sensor histidine kinase CreC
VKIRTAIFGVYVAVSAVGFAGLLGFGLREARARYVEGLQRTMHDTARLLANALESEPSGNGWAGRGALAGRFDAGVAGPAGLRIQVGDAAGRVIFDSAGSAVPDASNNRIEWAEAGGRSSGRAAVGGTDSGEADLGARESIRRDGHELGWVRVSRSLRTVNALIWSERRKLASVAFTVAALMVAAGWWISAKLTHSLERLTTYVLAVRDGRSASAPVSRAAEIAALSVAFEEMRATIEGKAYVERYTQTLTHEIKAPLSAIRGAAELLGEDLATEDRARFLANLRAETDRIRRIVDRMLELASLEARHGRVDLLDFDLRLLVQEVLAGALSVATARAVSLNLTPGPARPVRGERFLLAQAVTNLVQNALEFTPAGGTITVAIGESAGRVHVTIEDTGPGMPDYALPRLFDRFYSLPRPGTGRKSTGLGLSIVREIARLHQGDVTLENRREGGARAVLEFLSADALGGSHRRG